MRAINICAGFRTTGIHPLNADILKIPCQTKTDHKFIDSDEMQPFTPAKRQEDCFSSDSSFSSVSDYQQIERQNTIEMTNIDSKTYLSENSKLNHLIGKMTQKISFLLLNKVWLMPKRRKELKMSENKRKSRENKRNSRLQRVKGLCVDTLRVHIAEISTL